ncbi:hypothetical protein [Massilia sp. HP4]|uniref:hypothetical protein n=1 Tax=Massilia sp. HP4 TaxID=2562316 RepID=UPI0010C0E23F|nr:hypothetical protein [Massilia sp. HP4]
MTTTNDRTRAIQPQEQCIDLPGQAVRCWRSSDNLKVILRKHRDVFFDINLKPGAIYTVRAMSDFYCPLSKKLVRTVNFKDGERLHLWVGREFVGDLVLTRGSSVIGNFTVSTLDAERYSPDPKIKPEPLMVILGKREMSLSIIPNKNDPYDVRKFQDVFNPYYDPKVALLSAHGAKQEYSCSRGSADIQEYVCVTEAVVSDLQPDVLKKLDAGIAVEAPVSQIFKVPEKGNEPSGLYSALATTVANISRNDVLTSIWFKEGAGYLQEDWRMLDKILMKVRIEARKKGKYKVVFKGRLLSDLVKHGTSGALASTAHRSAALGSSGSAFIGASFAKDGKSGYGGFRRVIMTVAEDYRGGVKVQAIGTVIDIIVDVHDVYLKEEGSRDLSEFLGRAGVSLVKAGATAALASVLSTVAFASVAAVIPGGLFVVVGVVIAVVGLLAAAYVIDKIDEKLGAKNAVAEWAR